MTPSAVLAALLIVVMPGPGADAPAAPPSAETFAALGDDAVQDLVILGETRPILLRVRVMLGDRPFRAVWAEANRDGDDRLTPDRAASGPFQLQIERLAARRTDALFDHLDRDKDGQLTRSEMAAIVGSLHRLDRDADELIDADEVNLIAAPVPGRPARDPAVPPVLGLAPDESPVRLARMLIKRYDSGSSRGPGRRDSRLSPEEFAIPAGAFAEADTSGDGTLNAEELRAYLSMAPRDAILDVALAPDVSGVVLARVRGGDGGPPAGLVVRQLAEGMVEIDVGLTRLDIQVDDGEGAAETARAGFHARFEAADADQNGYLEADELTLEDGQPSPLAGGFKALDRDGDGKLYPRELDDYVARQAAEARGRLTLTASDEGRALFGILDMDRDRRLGAREVLDTFARVSACDRDRDGRVTPEEVPHHIRLTLTRGDLSDLLAPPPSSSPAVAAAPRARLAPASSRHADGPTWFRKMDRNRDGDVSRREFLGTRDQFNRFDRDHDGLLAPDEAEAAATARPVKAPGG